MKLTVISMLLLVAAVISAVFAGNAMRGICDSTEPDVSGALELALLGELDSAAAKIASAIDKWQSSSPLCELLFDRNDRTEAERALATAYDYARAGDGALCCGELRRASLSISALRSSVRLSLKNIF